jgi:L-seryl-tRNA(Ser) seleniumtransferase/D-glucosaminate-6-phosphate ammonia-lyase
MDVYEQIGVPTVINAAGKLTALGGTAQHEEIAAAQAAAAGRHVDVTELRAHAGEIVARATGAEAASITTGAAAGVVISVAAVVAGADPDLVARMPDSEGLRNRVVVQAGHWVNFGAPVEQMVRLGGGRPETAGDDGGVTEEQLTASLGGAEPAAALLYVQSHHSKQEGQVPLDRCIALAGEAGAPMIVDAAAEEDLTRYIALGVDLVTYSGGKTFGGPTVGFIAGRRDLIEACEAQTRGIARPMKVGKEPIAGLLAALVRYEQRDIKAEPERQRAVNATVLAALDGVEAVEASIHADEAGRPIERVAVRARDGAFDVRELVDFLAAGSRSIRTRNHHLPEGYFLIDPREVTRAQAETIAERLREYFA